jgi:hypothetical protein
MTSSRQIAFLSTFSEIECTTCFTRHGSLTSQRENSYRPENFYQQHRPIRNASARGAGPCPQKGRKRHHVCERVPIRIRE